MDRDAAEGASRGALVMALFGPVWAASGAGALGGTAGTAVLVLAVALAAALCLGAVRLRRAARDLPSDDSTQAQLGRERTSQRFNLVFALEGGAIAVAVVLLGRFGLGSFIPAATALVVGLHFFPLAALYGFRPYHLTGAALCGLALVAVWTTPSARLPLVGLGSAAVLFATAGYVLFLSGKATRSGASTPQAGASRPS